MTADPVPLGRRCLIRWVAAVCRAAPWVVLLALLSAVGSVVFTTQNIGINTSTKEMLSDELPFRRHDRAIDQAFPQLDQSILIVVEAPSPEQAELAADAIARRLAQRPGLFRSVFYPQGDEFFRRNGLLYLEVAELQDLSDRLARTQPLLATLVEDMSLRGLAEVFELTIRGSDPDAFEALAAALGAMADTVEGIARGSRVPLSWKTLLSGEAANPEARRYLITVEPVLRFDSLQPAAPAVAELRSLVRDLGVDRQAGVSVRLTGNAVMLQDELKSVRDGIGLVGLLSFGLVTLLLAIGLRSFRLVVATLVTLVVGLTWTAAFAAAAIGELNLISVAFAVLFIGLSVDFGIHFALRVQEEAAGGAAPFPAVLATAAGKVGGALSLTAVAAAIGFLSFLPTAYRGLSELGLIAGVGMFIALFANLTVLPALLALFPPAARPHRGGPRSASRFNGVVKRHAAKIAWIALGLGILALPALPAARFDDDPINLRDPESPSVATLLDILDDTRVDIYEIKILAPDLARAANLARTLSALPEVERTVTLQDFVPAGQDDKLDVIAEMGLFLAPLFAPSATRAPPSGPERRHALERIRAALAAIETGPAAAEAARLAAALAALDGSDAVLTTLETALLETLPTRIEALGAALSAAPVSLADLPETLVARKLAADGRSIVEVHPAADLRDRDERLRFVDAVSAIAPEATGAPVTITAAGRAVTTAFMQAAGIAVVLIAVLLLLTLRHLGHSLLVLAPLTLAALLTVAATVVLDLGFNFANVIVLPLLFGLGVAGGVHMVARRRDSGETELLETSTPRAVLFSALTTIGSFASLMLSEHRGTASMGELLTIAIVLSLVASLVVLPALLALTLRDGRPGN